MDGYKPSEAAVKLGLSIRRVQQMCKEGVLRDAVTENGRWSIPRESVDSFGRICDLPLPIGVSDYKKAVAEYYYVDKTLLIRDIIDRKPQVALFTRPRRFGKSLNMDMLKVFFEQSETDNSVYFRGKKIWNCGKKYRSYQGKYPVIYLTFKDVKYDSWDKAYTSIKTLIIREFTRHDYLLQEKGLSETDETWFRKVIAGSADETDYAASIEQLSRLLSIYHEIPAVIIIDEYDTPIQSGYQNGYYKEVTNFVRNLFSGAFKDNRYLQFGFLSGIQRVAKESIFSGMNNLRVFSITDNRFSEYFGFTREEVEEMLRAYGREEKLGEVCRWYDGYRFGETEIFNPWSVINYIDNDCNPGIFWLSTSGNDIIGDLISNSDTETLENMRKLLSGDKVTVFVDTGIIYPEIRSNPHSIYSFLLMTGYLRVAGTYPGQTGRMIVDVSIPNTEIFCVYEKEVIERNRLGITESTATMIRTAIGRKDFAALRELLQKFLLTTVSYMDIGNEAFYQGLLTGLCAVMNNTYYVRSNRESGLGRFDIALEPKEKDLPGFIFELKLTDNKKVSLKKESEAALCQIDRMAYETEMRDRGISEIEKAGFAFRGKEVEISVCDR